MATKRIKITDDRQGATFRTGVNGRLFDLPINQEINVDEALVDHLSSIGCRLEEVDTKGASSSKEGSVDGLAPIGAHDVRAPGTDAKSLGDRPLAGDQPGDVTAGDVRFSPSGVFPGGNITDDAEVSDIRVAGERRSPQRAPVAELAGEGEQGTKKADPQPVEPSHKATAAEKKARKPRKAKSNKVAAATPKAQPEQPTVISV